VAENGLRGSLLGLSVELDKYDGTTCLETFLASVRNLLHIIGGPRKTSCFA